MADRARRAENTDAQGSEPERAPWQLRMFSKSLKKRQKLDLLLRQLGTTYEKTCLLVTNGDNNGALNYHFRAHGGNWTWMDMEGDQIHEMQSLLGEAVIHGNPSKLPLSDASFDVVVSIDVHEHLTNTQPFNQELRRIVKPGGVVVVTTPNGDERKLMTRIKQWTGMTPEKYGHVVIGYEIPEIESMLANVGLEAEDSGSYSRFFTEFIEYGINIVYTFIRSRRRQGAADAEGIAPVTSEQFRSVASQYRIYALLFPFLWLASRLDALLFLQTGYAVSVRARRPIRQHG